MSLTVDQLAQVARRYAATKAVIAFPSASVKRVRQVAELARGVGLEVDIVPALTDLVNGRAEIAELRFKMPANLKNIYQQVSYASSRIHSAWTAIESYCLVQIHCDNRSFTGSQKTTEGD